MPEIRHFGTIQCFPVQITPTYDIVPGIFHLICAEDYQVYQFQQLKPWYYVICEIYYHFKNNQKLSIDSFQKAIARTYYIVPCKKNENLFSLISESQITKNNYGTMKYVPVITAESLKIIIVHFQNWYNLVLSSPNNSHI